MIKVNASAPGYNSSNTETNFKVQKWLPLFYDSKSNTNKLKIHMFKVVGKDCSKQIAWELMINFTHFW
jgi:hypothetical protein